MAKIKLTKIKFKTTGLIKELFAVDQTTKHELPLIATRISAGFPSPADDYIEKKLDLNEYLIEHPAATFFVRVEGDSMKDAGIQSGDILIIDRAITPRNNHVIIAQLNGEFTVKRVKYFNEELYLLPENNDYQPTKVTEAMDFEVWGVVTYVIHQVS